MWLCCADLPASVLAAFTLAATRYGISPALLRNPLAVNDGITCRRQAEKQSGGRR
jgi:hypothetical protein